MSDLNLPADASSVKEEALKSKLLVLNEDLGEETVVELSEVFIDSTAEILKKLDAATSAGNYPEIRNLVHSLRGNSGTFGFEFLVSTCKKLEVDITENKFEGTMDMLKIIVKEINDNVELLKRVLNQ